MELKIDRGLKSYDIEDADGTPLGTIYVNPADLGIAARLDEARKAVQALRCAAAGKGVQRLCAHH